MSFPIQPQGPLFVKEVTAQTLESVIVFEGKRYKVSYTPPQVADKTGFIYKEGHAETIQKIALKVLEERKKSAPEEIKTHQYKAIFTHEPDLAQADKATCKLYKRSLESEDFTQIDPVEATTLSDLAKLVEAGVERLELTLSPLRPTESPFPHIVIKKPIEIETGPLGKWYFKKDYDQARLNAAAFKDAIADPEEALTHALTVFKPVFKLPDQDDYTEILNSSYPAISNPASNCFSNALITSVFSNDDLYGYFSTICEEIKDQEADSNPSLEGLSEDQQGAYPQLLTDYKLWDISSPEKADHVFLSMTYKQAAGIAQELLGLWHDDKIPLNEKQSQLLKMSLIKLIAKKPSLEEDRAFLPHVENDTRNQLKIAWADQGSSGELLSSLMETFEEHNPPATFKNFQLELLEGSPNIDAIKGALEALDDPASINTLVLNCDFEERIKIPHFEDDDLLEDFELDSILVREATNAAGGHFFTYKIVKDDEGHSVILRYDDYKDPEVYVVSCEEFDAFCQAREETPEIQGLNPAVIVYKKKSAIE